MNWSSKTNSEQSSSSNDTKLMSSVVFLLEMQRACKIEFMITISSMSKRINMVLDRICSGLEREIWTKITGDTTATSSSLPLLLPLGHLKYMFSMFK